MIYSYFAFVSIQDVSTHSLKKENIVRLWVAAVCLCLYTPNPSDHNFPIRKHVMNCPSICLSLVTGFWNVQSIRSAEFWGSTLH